MTTSNYSIYAIPAFYILALVPHFYSTVLINRATNGRFNNVNPRGTSFSETCKKSLDKVTLGRFERARAAHTNALENLPLLASAVICANMAGLESGMVNSSEVLIREKFGLVDECWVLHDITVQGWERACRWQGDEAMSYGMGVKATEGKGKI
ncbi:MAG: hypothetical protein Q9175_001168 [Cornicularia normoerica]